MSASSAMELMHRRAPERVKPNYPPRILSRDAYYGAVTFDVAETIHR